MWALKFFSNFKALATAFQKKSYPKYARDQKGSQFPEFGQVTAENEWKAKVKCHVSRISADYASKVYKVCTISRDAKTEAMLKQ